jgi:hypothetical protein
MAFSDSQANAVVIPVSEDGISSVTLAGTVTKGDALGFSSGWKRALATTGSVIQMRCVALEDGVAGQRIAVCFGECYIKGGRFSGGTPNGALYVAEGSDSGKYTQTQPSTSGDATTRVGTMLSETDAIITPNYNPDSTAA